MVQIQSTYFPTHNLTLKRAFLHTRKRSSKGFCCWSLIEMPDTSWPTDYIIQKPMAIFNDYWNSTAALGWPLTSFLQLWHFIVDTIGFWHTIRKVPLLSVHHYYWRSCNTINVKSSKKTFFPTSVHLKQHSGHNNARLTNIRRCKFIAPLLYVTRKERVGCVMLGTML